MIDYTSSLAHIKFSRHAFIGLISKFSDEQLNTIPEGYKNNLIWNFAHSIVSLDYFCYYCSGNKGNLPMELSKKYTNGSKPEGTADAEEIKFWKEFAVKSLEKLEADLAAGLFDNYKPMDLGPHHKINNIVDAMNFSSFHEGSHFGYALAMKNNL